MGYIGVIEKEFVSKRWGNVSKRKFNRFECDHCGDVYDRRYADLSGDDPDKLRFCGRKCYTDSSRSGKLASKRESIFMERFGVKTPSMLDSAKKKMIETRIERYGSAAPIHDHPETAAKWRATMQERLGVDHPSKSADVKAKKRETNMRNHGVPSPFAKGSPFRKREDHVKGGQAGYRALVTKGKTWMISKPELDLKQLLEERFGVEDVKHQAAIDHGGRKPWLVDFYVGSIDTYVEMDGTFWHGQDDDHPKAQEARARDQKQNGWFERNDMRLVRITDKQLIECQKSNDFNSIWDKLGG